MKLQEQVFIDEDFVSLTNIEDVNLKNLKSICVKAIRNVEKILKIDIDVLSNLKLDEMIVAIDAVISEQLDAVMHHDKFKELESHWLSIWYLLQSTENDANISISVMDCDKHKLQENFANCNSIEDSVLYKEIYELEYNMPGGLPYSFIVADHTYTGDVRDISALSQISKVCAQSHCPFISSVNSSYLGLECFDELYKLGALEEYIEQPQFHHVRTLRNLDESKYLGLTLPKYIIRKPYGNLNPTANFNYIENVVDDTSYTWANASYLLAHNIIQSYSLSNGISQIQGPGAGGAITNLPSFGLLPSITKNIYRTATEVMLSETNEKKLANIGLIGFSLYKGNDKGCFFSTNSVHKPTTYCDPESMANAKINSQMTYVLLMSRIAHHLKIIHRESIGDISTKEGLSLALNKWLSNLVTKMPDPDINLINKRPLKDARVNVQDIENDPGNFDIDIFVVPHFKLEGVDIKLSLVSKLPKESSI
jgi:type VI secretion system protein ImpC